MKGPYKDIYIIRGAKDWYVEYKFETFKVRDGINRIHDPGEKEFEIQSLYKDVARSLKSGFSPFADRVAVNRQVDDKLAEVAKIKQQNAGWTLGTAISRYLLFIQTQGYSDRTIGTYKNYIIDLQDWLTEVGELDRVAATYQEFDLLTFIDTYTDERELSTRTYNNYLGFFGSFFNQARKLEKLDRKLRKLDYDMDLSDIELKITNPQRNRAFTPMLAKAIKKELDKDGNQDLRDYVQWIYFSLMRPKEIRNLKAADIDEESRQIRIVGKTGDRIVPISNQLLQLINKRKILASSPNSYVFGYAGQVDERRMGLEYMSAKFMVIKMNLNLDYDYTLYSWKHTAVIMLIKAGFTDDEIMVLGGGKRGPLTSAINATLSSTIAT